MSYTLFISDIHLSPDEPHIAALFKKTLAGPALQAEALYILGDLFEVWIGDNDHSIFHQDIIDTLQHFTQTSKIPTYFMHGNRDFLIGKRFLKNTGMQLLQDPTVIDLYGKRVALLHGDTLCVLDKTYQRFRKKTHHPLFKLVAYALPLCVKRKAAEKMRQKSKQHQSHVADAWMDVCPNEVKKVLHDTQADLMIHGHTHRPAIHTAENRVVLGSWHQEASILYCFDDGRMELITKALGYI